MTRTSRLGLAVRWAGGDLRPVEKREREREGEAACCSDGTCLRLNPEIQFEKKADRRRGLGIQVSCYVDRLCAYGAGEFGRVIE